MAGRQLGIEIKVIQLLSIIIMEKGTISDIEWCEKCWKRNKNNHL